MSSAARPVPGAVASIGRVVALSAISVLLLAMLLAATGQDVGVALRALVNGAVGSSYALLSATPVRAIPLALAGLAIAIAFRAGILNIGAEGQLLMGASAATALASVIALPAGTSHPLLPAWLTIVLLVGVGGVAGAAWAGIAAWLRQQFGVLEVISTIMLNYVALNFVGYLVRGPLQEPTHVNPQSLSLDPSYYLPMLVPGTRLHAGLALTVVLAFGLWWWLRSTASGFRVRAVGANARAAESAGLVNVARTTAGAFLLSGMLAGLAGSVQYTGVTYALYENFSPGYGYTAIAVALLARLHPVGVLGTALLFGALEAGANAMQRDAGVPNVVVSVVEATLILLIVAADRWQGRASLGMKDER